MSDLYLHGRSLVSALGADLDAATATLAAGGVNPRRVALPGGSDWPFFAIDHDGVSWQARARALVTRAAADAHIGQFRDAPLFVASSSFQIGAVEAGEATLAGDYADFADAIAAWLDWRGPVTLVSTACTSSLNALVAAGAALGAGQADDAVVLGIELANRYTLAGFAAMQLLSPTAARPLGTGRDGLVLGEAVAVLHLSRRPSRWRVCGGASRVDGTDPTGARAETVARLVHDVLGDAGWSAASVDLVKVQAAGSPYNDVNEAAGLADVFSPLPPLVTLKAQIGHTLGASGAAEIALLLACLERGVWPSLDYPIDADAGAALASSCPTAATRVLALILGFGGGYAAVALEDTGG